ncbi:MAG TPA: DNA recombination protein RmuC [Gaiellaceae bacterium]|nr:DNA recombination protein RmuC [Gaiellaceae bacterium]
MTGIAATVLLLLIAAAGGVWLVRLVRAELGRQRAESAAQLAELQSASGAQLAERSAEVDRRLGLVVETMDRRLAELDTKVDRRLASATETSSRIHERLGKLDEATAQMNERAKELSRLEHALRPPKARGGFGEVLLANLLADTFPGDKYALQHGFRSGERVDAVIRLDRALVPVDAKFPLDNFQRLAEAESDAERDLAAKQFCRDVKLHVDAIAQKYIRPDEGTYEFALMYLPAEAVYYELVCNRFGGAAGPLAYALEQNVIPVSPSTLHAYLLVLVLGFKGLQIEEHAREVMTYVADLNRDFSRFKTDFDLVGKHLGNAQTKFGDAEKRLSRFETKLERAAESELVEGNGADAIAETVHELPRALDAA